MSRDNPGCLHHPIWNVIAAIAGVLALFFAIYIWFIPKPPCYPFDCFTDLISAVTPTAISTFTPAVTPTVISTPTPIPGLVPTSTPKRSPSAPQAGFHWEFSPITYSSPISYSSFWMWFGWAIIGVPFFLISYISNRPPNDTNKKTASSGWDVLGDIIVAAIVVVIGGAIVACIGIVFGFLLSVLCNFFQLPYGFLISIIAEIISWFVLYNRGGANSHKKRAGS